MPTHASERPGLGDAAKAVAEHASALARLELQLATAELKQKVVPMALGIGMLAGAAIFGLLGLMLALAVSAAAIAILLPVWAAILAIMVGAFGLAGVLGIVGLVAIKKGTPPVPEQAIEEAKLTTEALKARNGH